MFLNCSYTFWKAASFPHTLVVVLISTSSVAALLSFCKSYNRVLYDLSFRRWLSLNWFNFFFLATSSTFDKFSESQPQTQWTSCSSSSTTEISTNPEYATTNYKAQPPTDGFLGSTSHKTGIYFHFSSVAYSLSLYFQITLNL